MIYQKKKKKSDINGLLTLQAAHHCLIFLSFLALFLNSRFSVEYCFLTNKLLIAVFTASAAARKTFSSTDTLPCNFSSSLSPPRISLSSKTVGSPGLLFSKPEMILTRAKGGLSKQCKLETPVTIHNNPAEELIPRLVGMKASPIIETTWKN